MEKNKVSIIVAIYKSEKFIKKLLESIINQSYKNLEIVLVDDGSPDNSGKICDDFAKIDKRIKVIHKKNGGACEARNVGLDNITGDYFTIIDGDDWLCEDYVYYLMDLILKNNADMSMTDKIFTTRDQVQIENDSVDLLSPEDATCMILYPKIPIGPWNKMYKTEIIKKNNICFDVPWSGEGLYFSAMSAQVSKKIALGHRKIYNYRLNNSGSGLTNYKLIMGTNALENIKNIGEKLIVKTKRTENAVKWHIWKNYNFVLKLIIATNSKKENINLYKECRTEIRKRIFGVIFGSELNIKYKIKMIFISIFPVAYAKKVIKCEIRDLARDNME